MPIHPLHVYCADIGAMCDSKRKNNFGWASQRVTTNNEHPRCCNGKDMRDLVNHVAQDLKQGSKVALGFECPLWIPVRDCPEELTRSRKGEENSWSAPGSLGSMATGLVQVPWLLQAIHHKAPDARASWIGIATSNLTMDSSYGRRTFLAKRTESLMIRRMLIFGTQRLRLQHLSRTFDPSDLRSPYLQTRSHVPSSALRSSGLAGQKTKTFSTKVV